jgi:alkylation response protein AidB-like acyl-CoA dehydrogenase
VRFLAAERAELERYLPGLDAELARLGTVALETDIGPALPAFKTAGGPGLLVPTDAGGSGASSVSAVRVQRAIGSRSPSLAVATTMHHFSVATIVEMTDRGLESILLEAVASQSLLVASGFGEGVPGQGVLAPTMHGTRAGKGIVLSGVKRPCSLTSSMDLLTVSARVDGKLAVVLVPPDLPGVTRKPFWRSPVLLGAQSGEVILDEVKVPGHLVSYSGDDGQLDGTQVGAFLWFETLISASYIGAASGLVELALEKPGPVSPELVTAMGRLESAMAATERIAHGLEGPDRTDDMLGRALLVRYGVQEAVFEAAAAAAELLGGVAFATMPAVSQLLGSCRALAYHPPSRTRMVARIGDWLDGKHLRMD